MCSGIGVGYVQKHRLVEIIIHLAHEIKRLEKIGHSQKDNYNWSMWAFDPVASRKELNEKSKDELIKIAKMVRNTLFDHYTWGWLDGLMSQKEYHEQQGA